MCYRAGNKQKSAQADQRPGLPRIACAFWKHLVTSLIGFAEPLNARKGKQSSDISWFERPGLRIQAETSGQ